MLVILVIGCEAKVKEKKRANYKQVKPNIIH